MTDNHQANIERRRNTRYRPGDLKITIAYPGLKGMLRSNPIVECLDFNALGLRFESVRRFNLDDRLIIDLCIREECIYELSALVCCARKVEDRYQCGTRFCFEEKRMQSDEVRRTLLNIESTLRMDAEYPEAAARSNTPNSHTAV